VIQSREERKKWDAFERELDAMLLSQELGIPTMNGYSGNIPQGWSSDNLAENFASYLRTANTFLSVHRLEQSGVATNNILFISSDGGESQPHLGSKR
jgi:sugar phosphate isomerase/epimerase